MVNVTNQALISLLTSMIRMTGTMNAQMKLVLYLNQHL